MVNRTHLGNLTGEQPNDADRELRQRVMDYLVQRQMPSLRRMGVQVRSGRVTLSGRVASFHQKQVALSCSRGVQGVRTVVDQMDVA